MSELKTCACASLKDFKNKIDAGEKPEDVFPYHFDFLKTHEEALEFFNYFYQIITDSYMRDWIRDRIEEEMKYVGW